jgi:hypothetical protein
VPRLTHGSSKGKFQTHAVACRPTGLILWAERASIAAKSLHIGDARNGFYAHPAFTTQSIRDRIGFEIVPADTSFPAIAD